MEYPDKNPFETEDESFSPVYLVVSGMILFVVAVVVQILFLAGSTA